MFLEMKVSCIVAIAMEIKKTPRPRPLTHDLLKNVIAAMGYEVSEIEITELRENTFYARLRIKKDGEELLVDSRPSDAIAIALRTGCRIMVDEEVIKASLSVKVGDKDQNAGDILEDIPAEDFGKYKM